MYLLRKSLFIQFSFYFNKDLIQGFDGLTCELCLSYVGGSRLDNSL